MSEKMVMDEAALLSMLTGALGTADAHLILDLGKHANASALRAVDTVVLSAPEHLRFSVAVVSVWMLQGSTTLAVEALPNIMEGKSRG